MQIANEPQILKQYQISKETQIMNGLEFEKNHQFPNKPKL